jgi:hypothetical protein
MIAAGSVAAFYKQLTLIVSFYATFKGVNSLASILNTHCHVHFLTAVRPVPTMNAHGARGRRRLISFHVGVRALANILPPSGQPETRRTRIISGLLIGQKQKENIVLSLD